MNESQKANGQSTVSSERERATHCAIPIKRLELSAHTYDILRQAGCRTVDDVLAIWPDRILQLNGTGHRFMREVYDSLRKAVPDRSSLLLPDFFRGRVSVQVPYSPDKNIFLNNAMAQWEACIQKDRARESASQRQMRRTLYENGSLEDDMEFLRMCRDGMTLGEIARKKKRSHAAMHARKRRLIVRYLHPIRLQRIPIELQEFVIQASQKYPSGFLIGQHKQVVPSRLPGKSQNGS